MLAHELRQAYIDFFESKGHLHLDGSPLTPQDALGSPDTSTLFTSAGMQQFKPYFIGAAEPPSGRIATVQKCVRTGDIDSVGDYSHCTFFEMLGNFSFGDYFKSEMIPWTWEFLTDVLKIDADRLCVTVYKDDNEAYEVWHKMVGLPEDRIHRLDASKNFWPANAIVDGPNGPCGPCSEIFFRVAPLEEMCSDATLTPSERYLVDDDAGRWLEIWNNVFTQFDRQEDENGEPLLVPLPKKNNDTGAGLDRIVCVLQGANSVFETDLFQPTLTHIEKLSGSTYTGTMSPTDFAFRVVAEHTRSMVFCIADGILPSNEGRGYVLRRIMRRAIRFGKTVLGFDEPFLHEVAPRIVEQMGDFYTELRDREPLILQTILTEEKSFRRTLDNGMRLLSDLLETGDGSQISGKDAFTLYDTYGFPLELTRELAEERGVKVDEAGFVAEMEEQRKRSREASGGKVVFGDEVLHGIGKLGGQTEFVGYTQTDCEATVQALFLKSGERADSVGPGDFADVVLDRTPFYAESGGQVGDTGVIAGPNGKAYVINTVKSGGLFLHTIEGIEGRLQVGDAVRADVDETRRMHIMRNHTATHLLQAAMRTVLGSHVHQKGSLVAPDRLRFDFTHAAPVTNEEIKRIESIVNAEILRDAPVHIHSDVPISEAKARGAMALFGEKYGDVVRMVEVPGFSLELCGGIHIAHTSQAGSFKIVSEGGIASGVRRIEAVTGDGALKVVAQQEQTIDAVASLLKTNPKELIAAAERLVQQRSDLEKQLKALKAAGASASLEVTSCEVAGVTVVVGSMDGAGPEAVGAAVQKESERHASAVIVLAGTEEGKVAFASRVSADLIPRGLHAGNLLREVAKVAGGGGGGRPDFAQAGGKDATKVAEALAKVSELVGAALS